MYADPIQPVGEDIEDSTRNNASNGVLVVW